MSGHDSALASESSLITDYLYRVGTPQRKQENWMLFVHTEKKQNLPKPIKTCFYLGNLPPKQKKLNWVMWRQCPCFCSKFWLRWHFYNGMRLFHSTRLHYICDCSLEGISNSICFSRLWNINLFFLCQTIIYRKNPKGNPVGCNNYTFAETMQ